MRVWTLSVSLRSGTSHTIHGDEMVLKAAIDEWATAAGQNEVERPKIITVEGIAEAADRAETRLVAAIDDICAMSVWYNSGY